tara:strand:+ start:284 stop:2131 length:1848 start_codon:yes stop_codon:yes gene_type:complete
MAIKFLHDLDVQGNIDLNNNQALNLVVQHLATNPSAEEGKIYYNTSNDVLMVCLGSTWTELSSAVGDITSVVAGAGMTGGGTSGDATLNVIGGGGITANANDVEVTPAQTTITSVYNAGLKIGRDTHNLIDFGTTDNQIDIRIGDNNELRLTPTAIHPFANDGQGLGIASKGFSDLFLASGAVINFDSSNVILTHSANTLTLGVDGNGSDFKLFGDTASRYLTWDASANSFVGVGASMDLSNNGGFTGDLTGDVTGNADTATLAADATTLATPRAINGVDFDGSAAITVTAAAGTLSGATLKSTVVTSSLTSVGALNSGSITSGFGTIDNGASAITTTGLISGGSLDIDNVLINGTTIGHTDDTDLITLANGQVTIAGGLTVTGTTTTNNVETVSTSSGVIFEGTAADGHDATLKSVVASSDKTYTLPNTTGFIGIFTTDPGTTNVTATTAELNALDLGATAVGNAIASKAVVLDSSKDFTGLNSIGSTSFVVGGHTVSDIDITSEATDADDHLMTALAVKNRIDDIVNARTKSYNLIVAAGTAVSGSVASNSDKTWTITHGMGSSLLYMVQVIQTANGNGETVTTSVKRTTTTVVIDFNVAPTSGDYTVVIVKI